MLRFEKVEKFYGTHEVLTGVDWSIPPRSRVGLVGPNGAGKSTLLRLVAGIEEPDRGVIVRPRGTELGYLPQEGARVAEGTLLEAILSPFARVRAMEHELMVMHEAMATARGEALERLTWESGELQHRFEVAGGFELESRARAILTGLGFAAEDATRPLAEFSGGFRMRAALGALLLKNPDYILLDEPTNHLDLDGIAWLETYLQQITSALVVVSHDRVFLNRVVRSIADLDRGKVKVWTGNYDSFRSQKASARELALKQAIQEGRRRAEVERFIERFRYKATKARQVQSRVKMLEKMKATDVPVGDPEWQFRFPPVPRSAKRVLLLADVVRSFDSRLVLRGLNLEIWRGERVALCGPNGCGKSTLLKLVAGDLPPDSGRIEIGSNVALHYFAQHVLETLTAGRTLLEELQAWAPGRSEREIRSLLGMFQFSGNDAFKRVEVLSGGEKNRLAMARLMLDPGNFLLLDEPTNHLDLPAREALEQALARFEGALLFVSHDRYFINEVATKVVGFRGGRVAVYDGGYDDYRATLDEEVSGGRIKKIGQGKKKSPDASRSKGVKREAKKKGVPAETNSAAKSSLSAPSSSPVNRRQQRRTEASARNERNQRIRPMRREVQRLEGEIAAVEKKLKETLAELADPQTYQTPDRGRALGEARKSLEVDLAHLYDDWDHAARTLQKVEGKPITSRAR